MGNNTSSSGEGKCGSEQDDQSVEQLAVDVRRVLTDCPHETSSPGSGVMESEEWGLEIRGEEVVLSWERTWSGSLGGYSGILCSYFEYESRIRDDDTGGEFHITGRTNHEHWTT